MKKTIEMKKYLSRISKISNKYLNMKNSNYSVFKIILIISIGFFSCSINGQEVVVDDPNLDQIPQWYLDQTQKMTRMNSQVITINDFDNFYLGIDFAEGHISANPLVPTEFFNAFNTDGAHTTMNGHDWVDSNPSWGSSMRGDPVTAYDGLGNLYYENMYGGGSILGCKVVKSSDNGLTWNTAVNAISGNDKNWIACDQTDGPYANYVYTTMTNSGSGRFMRSIDNGLSYQNTFNASTQYLPGMMVCVGADGDTQGGAVYVVTNGGGSFSSTYTFYQSLDGGSTFQFMSSQNFAGYVGSNVNGRNSVENMRTRPYPFITADNSYGDYRGRLHLVYASNTPTGNGNKPDIWSRYSDDGGASWSDAKIVNDDPFSAVNHQWQPATWCDKETGKLYIQWMDTRDTPTSDSALIYATYSDDGGQTYKQNQRISNQKMKINCNTCGGGGTPRYQGDYSGIASNSDVSVSTWSDFRWGSFASFTAYLPDFAMRVYPLSQEIPYSDTIWAIVPDVKLYDNQAIFTAVVEEPASGSFTIEYPYDSILTTFPDSLPIVITANAVPLGQYSVTIKGEGPNGTPVHFREAMIEIIHLPAPVANFSVNDTTSCVDTGLDFFDNSLNGPTTWSWTFEGGVPATSTEQNPEGIVYATSGTFDVSLEVTNETDTNLITKVDFITVSLMPESPTGENVFVCKNIEIPPLSAEGIDIFWYTDPELLDFVFEGNIFYTEDTLPGIYTYYATQTVVGCESEATVFTLTIYDTPIVSFAPMDSVCLSTEQFELLNGLPADGTYFGQGVTNGMFDALEAGEGTHNLGYTFTNENMCTDTAYQVITVMSVPDVSFEAQTSVCISTEPFQLTGGSPEDGTYSGDGVVDDWFYPEDAGAGEHDISYSIIGENGCSNSTSQTLVVFELPQINIGNDTVVCSFETVTLDATITNGSSYLWTPGDFTTPIITVDSIGIGYGSQEYSVLVTDNNGCSSTDATLIAFNDCTGIKDIVGLENVNVFPNPNDGSFNIDITSLRLITVDLKIFDVLGVKYMDQKQLVIDGKYSTKINLQDIRAGLYFITLKNDDGVFIKKFLVK